MRQTATLYLWSRSREKGALVPGWLFLQSRPRRVEECHPHSGLIFLPQCTNLETLSHRFVFEATLELVKMTVLTITCGEQYSLRSSSPTQQSHNTWGCRGPPSYQDHHRGVQTQAALRSLTHFCLWVSHGDFWPLACGQLWDHRSPRLLKQKDWCLQGSILSPHCADSEAESQRRTF